MKSITAALLGAVFSNCAHDTGATKPPLTVSDIMVADNRDMEMDSADYVSKPHRGAHMSLKRDEVISQYEDGFVQNLRDNRMTASDSKSWFDDDSGNRCCAKRDVRTNKNLCHVALSSSCRAEFGYAEVYVVPGESREAKFASCCGFVDEGFDSGFCMRSNCISPDFASRAHPFLQSPALHLPAGANNEGLPLEVHVLTVPDNVRAEVPNISSRLRSLLFAEETKGKTLLERQFGVYVTVDDMDSLIIYGASPTNVEQCMLLVEECVKSEQFCLDWYRGERGTEMAHTLVHNGRPGIGQISVARNEPISTLRRAQPPIERSGLRPSQFPTSQHGFP